MQRLSAQYYSIAFIPHENQNCEMVMSKLEGEENPFWVLPHPAWERNKQGDGYFSFFIFFEHLELFCK